MSELKAYPEYKDSGVEWIGDVPKHWGTTKIKYMSNERLIYGANETAVMDDKSLPRYIRITDIDKNGALREDTYKSLPEHIASKYPVEQGDVLFARSGASVGKTYIHQSIQNACYAGYLCKSALYFRLPYSN
jgi:type I restriction enzyme S subunit